MPSDKLQVKNVVFVDAEERKLTDDTNLHDVKGCQYSKRNNNIRQDINGCFKRNATHCIHLSISVCVYPCVYMRMNVRMFVCLNASLVDRTKMLWVLVDQYHELQCRQMSLDSVSMAYKMVKKWRIKKSAVFSPSCRPLKCYPMTFGDAVLMILIYVLKVKDSNTDNL